MNILKLLKPYRDIQKRTATEVERFEIKKTGNKWYIYRHIDNRRPVVIGRYKTEEEARNALSVVERSKTVQE